MPDNETIQELIETARYAPTAGNQQPLSWTVFTKKEDVKTIAELTVDWMRSAIATLDQNMLTSYLPLIVAAWDSGMDVILHNAPVLVVVSASKEVPFGITDACISLSYLELAALPMGLGTCWAGLVQAALLGHEPLRELIGLPKSHTHHFPMMLGYPRYRYHRLPERKAPRIFWR
jgi:nitroreductase